MDNNAFDEQFADEIGRAVKAVHPDMAWEIGVGISARRQFCLSPEGRPDVRQAALRWLAEAPASDQDWEFYASRQANPEQLTLVIGDARFELGQVRAISSWDPTRRRLNVRLWHPLFDQISEQNRVQVAFLFLDGLLGEDDVERWIGDVEALEAPAGGRTPDELRAEVQRRREEASDETWILAEGEGPDGPFVVVADAALKRIDHPFADHHVMIRVALDGPQTDEDAEALNHEEDDLVRRLEGLATYAGRVTTSQTRTLHLVTENIVAARSVVDGWAKSLPRRRIKVNFEEDAAWSFQRALGV